MKSKGFFTDEMVNTLTGIFAIAWLSLVVFLISFAYSFAAFITDDGTVTANTSYHYYIYENGSDSTYIREFDGSTIPVYVPSTVQEMQTFWGQDFTNTTWYAILGDTCTPLIRTECAPYALDDTIWPIPAVANIWGSDNGFWGDVTAADVAETMRAGVAETGTDIWPLFAFVGIVIAFGIAGLLVYFINQALKKPLISRKNKEIINTGGEDFIYHNADTLELKREYGQPKRRRGRPRKTL